MIEKEIQKLVLPNGLVPFDEWFDSLRDRKSQVAVDALLSRVRAGNFGDCKSVGGDKRRQSRDIHRAQQLWQEFQKSCT